jgi:hypothetical protein
MSNKGAPGRPFIIYFEREVKRLNDFCSSYNFQLLVTTICIDHDFFSTLIVLLLKERPFLWLVDIKIN